MRSSVKTMHLIQKTFNCLYLNLRRRLSRWICSFCVPRTPRVLRVPETRRCRICWFTSLSPVPSTPESKAPSATRTVVYFISIRIPVEQVLCYSLDNVRSTSLEYHREGCDGQLRSDGVFVLSTPANLWSERWTRACAARDKKPGYEC